MRANCPSRRGPRKWMRREWFRRGRRWATTVGWPRSCRSSRAADYRDGRTYTVSVAVFYKRPLGLAVSATPDPETDPQWTYEIAIPSSIATATISGTAKSDTTLPPTFLDVDSDDKYDQEAGDESHIKSGQWGLVTYLTSAQSSGPAGTVSARSASPALRAVRSMKR